MLGISHPVVVDLHKDAWLLSIYTKEETEHSYERWIDSVVQGFCLIVLNIDLLHVGISIVVSFGCRSGLLYFVRWHSAFQPFQH